VILAQLGRDADTFVIAARRHPDIDDHNVRAHRVDRFEEAIPVFRGRYELYAPDLAEYLSERIPDEVRVVGDRDPDRLARLAPLRPRVLARPGAPDDASDRFRLPIACDGRFPPTSMGLFVRATLPRERRNLRVDAIRI